MHHFCVVQKGVWAEVQKLQRHLAESNRVAGRPADKLC